MVKKITFYYIAADAAVDWYDYFAYKFHLIIARNDRRTYKTRFHNYDNLTQLFIISELERAIAERARRLEQAVMPEETDPATNPTLQEVRARLRHAAPASPAATQ